MSVRRYPRSARVVTEVQGNYTPPQKVDAERFGIMKEGFDKGVDFLRPAVTKEQTARGEKEAMEAIENDSFEMRAPFTQRNAAFNKTGERVISNKAMIQLDEEMHKAMRKADGSIGTLNKELERIKSEIGGQLPEIPGLQTSWLESYDRAVSTSRRQTTELARRRAVAAQKRAAADAVAVTEQEVARLALTAGTPDELAAALSAGVVDLAQYGPRGAFEVNGQKFEADPSRAGIYTPRQIGTLSKGLQSKAHELFLKADYERSDNPSQWAEEFQQTVLSGNSPLPPGKSLTLMGQFEAKARADETRRLADERRIQKQQADAAEKGINPYVTALENGMMVAPPDDVRVDLLAGAAGNADLTGALETQFAAADAIVEMQGMNPSERAAYIKKVQQDFIDTPGITPMEAGVINALGPYLKAAESAITRETVGVSAAEQMVSSGSILDEEQIADLRVRAAGNPEIAKSVEVIVEAQEVISSGQDLTGTQREEWINRLNTELAELAIQGDSLGSAAQLRMDGIELAQDHFDTLNTAANNDVSRFAEISGIQMPPLITDETTGLGQVGAAIAERVNMIAPATAQYGNDNPVPLSGSEKEMLIDMMRDSNNTSRVEFLNQIGKLPSGQRSSVISALGVDNKSLIGAGRVQTTNPSASRTILAGMNATIKNPDITTRAETEAGMSAGMLFEGLAPGELEQVRETATAYAKGMAVRNGDVEVLPEDLRAGYDIALGADENGDGGIEEVSNAGFTTGFFRYNYGTAILPTGVRGSDVAARLDSLDTDEDLTAFAGGQVIDINGTPFTAKQMKKQISGFRVFQPDEGPSMLVPLTEGGEMFIVQGENGIPLPLMFDPRAPADE